MLQKDLDISKKAKNYYWKITIFQFWRLLLLSLQVFNADCENGIAIL